MSWHSVGWASGLEIELAIRFDGSSWDDVTDDLRSFSCSISRSRALGVFPPGTATFNLDNRSGDYTPLNGSSPYAGDIYPGRHIRFKARYSATDYDVWYGIVDDWGDSYPQARDGIATVSATQPSRLLAENRSTSFAEVGADELSGSRVSRVLTAAGWPLSSTVAAGITRLQATTLEADFLSELQRAVDVEMGAFWCEPDGSVTFEGRHDLVHNTRSNTSQVTFGNGGGAEVPYLADPTPPLSSGLDLVINQATITYAGGSPYSHTDASSVSTLELTRALSETLYGSTAGPNYAEGNARGVVYRYALPYQHPSQITLRPAGRPSVAWAQALGRRIRDKATVKVPTPWGVTYSCPVWLVGVTHAGQPGDWTTTFEFEPADALASTGFAKWGTGVWGTFKWAY